MALSEFFSEHFLKFDGSAAGRTLWIQKQTPAKNWITWNGIRTRQGKLDWRDHKNGEEYGYRLKMANQDIARLVLCGRGPVYTWTEPHPHGPFGWAVGGLCGAGGAVRGIGGGGRSMGEVGRRGRRWKTKR